jgi:hypothetical protein
LKNVEFEKRCGKLPTSRDELEATRDLVAPALREGGVWRVCEDYKPMEPKKRASTYLVPAYPLEREDKWRTIKPLEEAPDLLLEFAEAYRQAWEKRRYVEGVGWKARGFLDPVLGFVRQYGLLGVGGRWWYGGRKETLKAYVAEMIRASNVLGL